MGQGVRDEYVVLNGLRFHYRDWGDLSAPPIILLHGFTGHARSWDTLAAALAGKYRVLALDQRGHGESGWAEDYSTQAMVSDVAAFVAALGLRSFDLLGLSMGGSNAYHYAGTRPEGLQRLVIWKRFGIRCRQSSTVTLAMQISQKSQRVVASNRMAWRWRCAA